MKIIFTFVLLNIVSISIFAAQTFISVPNSQSKIFYQIDSHWRIIDDGNKPNQIRKIFVRNVGENSSRLNDNNPSMLVQIDDIKGKGSLDPIMYQIASMKSLPTIHSKKYFSFADHYVKIKSVVGVYGFAVFENNKKFIMSNITFTFGTKGVKVIFMCPISQFAAITKEFDGFLSSLELQTDDVIPEVKEIQKSGATYLKYGDMGIVKTT